jgi:anti-sigma factor RsiW
MRESMMHLSDEDLLSEADGELDARRSAEVRAHLAACWNCRARMHRLEAAIGAFVAAREAEDDAHIAPPDGPRALLRARMAQLTRDEELGARANARDTWWRPWSIAGLTAAALLLVVFGSTLRAPAPSNPVTPLTPVTQLTPGATVLLPQHVVCAEPPEVAAPAVSRRVALTIFRTYGIESPRPDAYELDFLIAPELGGSTDVRNLWPQPYSGIWNAHLKDALEDHLHDLVCSDRLDLATAQREIATDWITAYRKYFGTAEPLREHLGFRKDRPWR